MMQHKNSIIHFQSTNTSSVSTLGAIKTDYAILFVISMVPLFILFYCVAYAIIKCCCNISKGRVCSRKTADGGSELPQSTFHSLESGSEQFRSKKTHDEKRF